MASLAVGDQPPQLLGRVRRRRGSGRPCRRSRSARRRLAARTGATGAPGLRPRSPPSGSQQVRRRARRGWGSRRPGWRAAAAGGRVEPVAQLDRGQRVEAEVLERPPGRWCLPRRVRGRGRGSWLATSSAAGCGCSAAGSGARRSRRRCRTRLRPRSGARAADRCPHQAAQQRRAVASPVRGPRAQHVEVQRTGTSTASPSARRRRTGPGPARSVSGGMPARAMRRRSASSRCAVMPLASGPEAPGQGQRGQALGAAVLGERVEEGVGRRVVGLARAAEHAGGGGEQHERGQVQVRGQLVQMPGGVDLRAQHPSTRSGGVERRSTTPSSRTPAVWTTAVSGCSGGIAASSRGQLRRGRPTSQAAIVRLAPSSRPARRAARPRPARSGPRRLSSSRCRTPCSATSAGPARPPRPPVPPVISTVPLRVQRHAARSARSCRRAGPGSCSRNASRRLADVPGRDRQRRQHAGARTAPPARPASRRSGPGPPPCRSNAR